MKFLARLMSHGFSIALVVLLAIGFMYRGELFPEWELPEFLALDSVKDAADSDQSAGKIASTAQKGERTEWVDGSQAASEVAEGAGGQTTLAGSAATRVPVAEQAVDVVPAHAEVAPVADAVQASTKPAALSTGSGHRTASPADAMHANEPDKTGTTLTPATAVPGAAASAAAVTKSGLSAKSVSGVTATDSPHVAKAPEKSATQPAKAIVSPVMPGLSDAPTQAAVRSASAPASTEAGTAGSTKTPVHAAATEMSKTAPLSAPDDARAQVPVTAASADARASSYQLLALAREAYWMRDFQAAEDYYRQMIRKEPDNPDGYGELANMYFSQGNWEAAARAYSNAGSRLAKQGYFAPARELVDVIRGLNGPQADALEQEIEATEASAQ